MAPLFVIGTAVFLLVWIIVPFCVFAFVACSCIERRRINESTHEKW